jgi:5-methylcytosine-specific restriction endonuclease McrA
VHHVVPYHTDKALECDPENLATMCHECHLSVGHAYDWKSWRPDVRRLAEMLRSAEVKR